MMSLKLSNPTNKPFPRITEVLRKSQPELLEFLSAYVQIPSEAPKEGTASVRKCQEWLEQTLQAWGWGPWIDMWEVAPGEPNLAVRLPGRSSEPRLMFNGHTDVVPVAPSESRWRYGPYSGEISGGRLWGRGASDMKGGVAAFLWAAKTVMEIEGELEHDLLLTVNIGEESARPEIGVSSVLERGYRAPLVINAEPSNLRIYRAAMGWFFLEITVTGQSTHPANRYLCVDPKIPIEERPGADANDKMRLVINALADLRDSWAERPTSPIAPPYSTNMTLVHLNGGTRSAALADACKATYAVVFDPDLKSDDVIDEIRKCVAAAAQKDEWLRRTPPEIKVPVIDPVWEPMQLGRGHPGVQDVARAVEAVLDEPPIFGCFPGPCDANVISNSGLDTLIFGPGDLSFGCHGVDEYVPTSQVTAACEVYAHLILTRCA